MSEPDPHSSTRSAFGGKELAPQPDPSVLYYELTAFAVRAGHDLSGPLNQAATLVSLFVKTHEQEGGKDPLLLHLKNAAKRMTSLLAGMRCFLEIAGSRPDFQPASASAALTACQVLLQKMIMETDARVTSGPLPEVWADDTHLIALFSSLLENALLFRKSGERPVIHISALRAGAFWSFTIADNGTGIEQAEAALLPFKRLSAGHSGELDSEGSGMGLAIANLIVRLHGGGIAIQSQPGEGTSVTFTLRAVAEACPQ